MFRSFNEIHPGGEPAPPHACVTTLPPREARLLWALRRLALMQPVGAARCHAVHIALQLEFGDAGLGLEHLLRCCLVGLARQSVRRLVVGVPACPLLLADEITILALLRGSDDAGPGQLERLTGSERARQLLPLFRSAGSLAGIYAG